MAAASKNSFELGEAKRRDGELGIGRSEAEGWVISY